MSLDCVRTPKYKSLSLFTAILIILIGISLEYIKHLSIMSTSLRCVLSVVSTYFGWMFSYWNLSNVGIQYYFYVGYSWFSGERGDDAKVAAAGASTLETVSNLISTWQNNTCLFYRDNTFVNYRNIKQSLKTSLINIFWHISVLSALRVYRHGLT